jgi:carboxypeptidase Taq
MSLAAYTELEQRYAEIKDLSNGLSILGWDQEVMMPSGGGNGRAYTLAALSGVVHERWTDPELGKLVRRLSRAGAAVTPRQRRSVALVRRSMDRACATPADLARRIALAESQGVESWRAARAAKRFAPFADDLARMVDLRREQARCIARRGKVYDALLDHFEPGATMASIDPLLDELVSFSRPLLQRVLDSGVKVDTSPLRGRFGADAQQAFAADVTAAMGIDSDRARLDTSTHPFCGGVGPGDVRLTTRYDERDLRGALFGVIHEAGHGLYEQGLDPKRARSPLGGAISMGIHESQSRLWENMVARGKPFWRYWLPRIKRRHPSMKGVSLNAMVAAVNAITPSMIRVEADELTYNLHIALRYRLERDVMEGRIEVRDLPGAWNDGMHELLGITPRHDAEGVLQDIHWASGLFGYFPTYSLGNLYAAQFMAAARKALRGLDASLAAGDMSRLRVWLSEQIHRHDQVYDADKLVRRVTGKPLGTEAFRKHITSKVKAIHG